MNLRWHWGKASPEYGNFGNPNQWTLTAGLASLARESTQNSNDARLIGERPEIVYTLIRLRGEERAAFEQALGWSTLQPHLSAMSEAAEASVMARQIKEGLEAYDRSDELLLLRIEDYGCAGLTGPEYPSDEVDENDYGNFIRLCRLDLFSGKEEAAGGSFGLGKAVYWRFSRFQTVLFNSVLCAPEPATGQSVNRLFGVNQGTDHRLADQRVLGRGTFGVDDEVDGEGTTRSLFADNDTVSSLHLDRIDDRPGTSALVIGFHDPDAPETDLDGLVRGLRDGVELNFWPLLARDHATIRIAVRDGDRHDDYVVDPKGPMAELYRALARFDRGEADEKLENPYDMVVRDIRIEVPGRKSDPTHSAFTHTAKLVVVKSDANEDALQNKVCLFRKPEMIVETIDKQFAGETYHAFLIAGAAIAPGIDDEDARRADDFLRFAEPPAHNQWIPRSGSRQLSQVNLSGNYVTGWGAKLRRIETQILEALVELFGEIPQATDTGPKAVMKRLPFGPGIGPGPGRGGGKGPTVTLTEWQVIDGCWHVDFDVVCRNRKEGWEFTPVLVFVGDDGKRTPVDWQVTVRGGAEIRDTGSVAVTGAPSGRRVTARLTGRSVIDTPIPAAEAAIDVVLKSTKALTSAGVEQ